MHDKVIYEYHELFASIQISIIYLIYFIFYIEYDEKRVYQKLFIFNKLKK